ncbi:MAG TPA: CBS domain-containing protein [Mycobacteriales bacterium]|nr:CBS domain-containing protein [Mycobacteriales bacterium]
MKIQDVIRAKGSDVSTVGPDTTIIDLLSALAERGVGAMVVMSDAGSLVGIVSERDVVRQLHSRGPSMLGGSVQDIMTTDVATCEPRDDIEHVMRMMTERRFRHLPVMAGGQLAGIVSIGDVVKSRIDELVTTTAHLENYISGS